MTRLTLLLIGVVTSSAMIGEGPPIRRHPSLELEKDCAISIAASAEQNPIKAGSELWVSVLLRNISSEDLYEDAFGIGPDVQIFYRVSVLDQNGGTVPFTKNGDPYRANWHGVESGAWLKPGEALKPQERLFISKWWNVSKPGKYTILVQRVDSASHQIAKAGPVIVTVTE